MARVKRSPIARAREWTIHLFGGATADEVSTKARRAYEAGFDDGNDEPALATADGRAITTGYRSTTATRRDLSSISQEKAIEATYRLWNTHPLAKALIEIMVDYILGDGARVEARNDAVQKTLDAFWFDPVNQLGDSDGGMGPGQEQLVRELLLFGEQLILAFVRDGSDKGMVADGLVRIGTVDPAQIHAIITSPANRREVLAVRLKSAGGQEGAVYKVIGSRGKGQPLTGARDLAAYREAVMAGSGQERDGSRLRIRGREYLVDDSGSGRLRLQETETLYDGEVEGECFLFQINKVSTGVRGRPEILPLIDWLDRFDQLFFDGAEHVAMLNAFTWDLTVQGGSEKSAEPELNLKRQAGVVAKLRPGSVYAHNEKVGLDAKNPELRTADLETIIRQLRVFISGGARIPEHWLAEGGYTNRSTAVAMGEPTFRMLARKQAIAKAMFTRLCEYQIDAAVALGQLDEMVEIPGADGDAPGKMEPAREAFTVHMPDINISDTEAAARTLGEVAQAAVLMMSSQLISKKPALEMIAAAAEALGVDLDVSALLEETEENPALPEIEDLVKRLAGRNGNGAKGEPEEEENAG